MAGRKLSREQDQDEFLSKRRKWEIDFTESHLKPLYAERQTAARGMHQVNYFWGMATYLDKHVREQGELKGNIPRDYEIGTLFRDVILPSGDPFHDSESDIDIENDSDDTYEEDDSDSGEGSSINEEDDSDSDEEDDYEWGNERLPRFGL